MNVGDFHLGGIPLHMLPSGAVWWPGAACLIVSDLHLGKAERVARRSGQMLPPYETRDTLARLDRDCRTTGAERVICLGDSFDDDAARDALGQFELDRIGELQRGRDWIWVEGNHDPSAGPPGGRSCPSMCLDGLTFRHIAMKGADREVSGHYHPKARLALRGRCLSRPCLLHDARRAILPAYGTYTGGLDWTAPALAALMSPGARALLTGPRPIALPYPARVRA